MFAEDKFSIDKHINFSPKLIGEVMNAYKKIAVQVRNKIEPAEPKQIEMQIDEEQVMKDEAEYWKTSKKDWRFLNYQCFDYLWKRKLIKISPEKADLIKARVNAYNMSLVKKPSDLKVDEETFRQQCNVKVAERHPRAAEELAAEIAEAEEALGGDGRVLVRASGTEPLIRVMVEAATDEVARAVAHRLAEAVERRFA